MSDLMSAFNFTPADLDTNRKGYLTNEQKTNLKRMRLEASILPAIFIAFSVALFVDTVRARFPADSYVRLIGVSIPVLVAIGFFLLRWLRITMDLRARAVNTLAGRAVLGAMRTGNLGYYGSGFRLKIENIDFIVPWAARAGFTEGKKYRIYYTPNAKIVVSAE